MPEDRKIAVFKPFTLSQWVDIKRALEEQARQLGKEVLKYTKETQNEQSSYADECLANASERFAEAEKLRELFENTDAADGTPLWHNIDGREGAVFVPEYAYAKESVKAELRGSTIIN